jgi:peptide/nickel transport system permease protein
MIAYILRRLGFSVLTILGVMIVTFLLFRGIAGDIAAANLGAKATEARKEAWRQSYGYNKPKWANLHRQLLIVDHTIGQPQDRRPLSVEDAGGSNAADALALILSDRPMPGQEGKQGRTAVNELMGRYVYRLSDQTPLWTLTGGKPVANRQEAESRAPTPPASQPASAPATATASAPAPVASSQPGSLPATAASTAPITASASVPTGAPQASQPAITAPTMVFSLADGSKVMVRVDEEIGTAGELLRRINGAPGNSGRLVAAYSRWTPMQFFDSQFFRHFWTSATFQSRSLKDNKPLTQIIRDHAPASLAIAVPALALEWLLGLTIACFVAYYRDSTLDRVGVLLSVLAMCIPFLAFMIFGHWVVNRINPEYAYGQIHRINIYLPIAISVLAGLGGMVRFYRTIILDETGRDYVRTARAKGLPLTSILFKHVLKNCMLPILTSLIMAIPFLIMGNLLLESYFGIPGLGDLMITSINDRNEPIMNGLVFLTGLIWTVGVLVTDICYAIFDPRIRLQ